MKLLSIHQRHLLMLILTMITLIVSGINPFDRATWVMEVLPVLIAAPLLWFTYKKFQFSHLVYWCIFLHALILIIGATYTYARVPAGLVVQDWFDFTRNPYDKLGHFFQGFAPILITREILLRNRILQTGKMLVFICICIVLAISATYELLEWAAAVTMGQSADEFLGTQGDEWDAQSDMFFALIGGTSALIFFSALQDKQIKKLNLQKGDGES
jgi:putative membrane protein